MLEALVARASVLTKPALEKAKALVEVSLEDQSTWSLPPVA
jgi:hypothetical protein